MAAGRALGERVPRYIKLLQVNRPHLATQLLVVRERLARASLHQAVTGGPPTPCPAAFCA
jgi:hypothetical protein